MTVRPYLAWFVFGACMGPAVACGGDSGSENPFGDGVADASTIAGSGGTSEGGTGGGSPGGANQGGSGARTAAGTGGGGTAGSGAGGMGGSVAGGGGTSGSGGSDAAATGGFAGVVDAGVADGSDDASVQADGAPPDVADAASSQDDAEAAAGACASLSACCGTLPTGGFKSSCENQASSGDEATCALVEPFFCGGAGDGGTSDAGSGCSELSACCATLAGSDKSQCEQLVALGDDGFCDLALGAYQSGAMCN